MRSGNVGCSVKTVKAAIEFWNWESLADVLGDVLKIFG